MLRLNAAKGAASIDNNRRTAIVAGALVLGLVGSGALVLRGTDAVFTANTDNGSNSWATGSVALTDNDGGTAMFSATGMMPGTTITKCITATYSGSGAAPVKVFTQSSSLDTLGDDLEITIEQASAAGVVTDDCVGFGASTPIQATADFATFAAKNSYATGVGAWTPTGADTRAYRFTVKLKSATLIAEQGKTATATFRWEAQGGS